ncbi:MAG: type II toxin-antitoxin system VapB family antitoxin [Ferruginibacter sp.]|nr:type II toxin-antitoxin system VapB family antitoxin [Cytophagales bacterium]
MRINIDIDEELLNQAKALAQAKTKKEVVELALRNLIDSLQRKQMLSLRGKVAWEGDLDEMRRS